jgi:hypothetical protein
VHAWLFINTTSFLYKLTMSWSHSRARRSNDESLSRPHLISELPNTSGFDRSSTGDQKGGACRARAVGKGTTAEGRFIDMETKGHPTARRSAFYFACPMTNELCLLPIRFSN